MLNNQLQLCKFDLLRPTVRALPNLPFEADLRKKKGRGKITLSPFSLIEMFANRSNPCVFRHLYSLCLLYLYAPSPEVAVFVVVSTAHVFAPQDSGGIPALSDALIPVFVFLVVDLDISQRSKFFVFPNGDLFARSSSSFEVGGQESVRNSIDVRTNYGFYSTLSNLGVHRNRILEYRHNNPNLGHNNVSDTNGLPTNATTNHSRKKDLRLCPEQHKHPPYQAARSLVVVLER
jgi:hypothetical protein